MSKPENRPLHNNNNKDNNAGLSGFSHNPNGRPKKENNLKQKGAATDSVQYPRRPEEPNCMYFLRTGSCGYGTNCRYNHPTNVAQDAVCGFGSELPERDREPDCGGVVNGFPLKIEAVKVIEKQVDINVDFLKNMFPKVEWMALAEAARSMGYTELPEEVDSSMLESEELLKKFHHALLELHLEEGTLFCPETGRRFSVIKGIPNMLLHEDEV